MKIRNVDKLSPLRELWEELHDKKGIAVIVLILDLMIADLLSSTIYILIQRAIHYVFESRPLVPFTAQTLTVFGLTKLWWLTIIFFIFLAYQSFKMYRALNHRKYDKNYEKNYLKSQNESFGGAHFQTIEELKDNCNRYPNVEYTTENVLGIDEEGKLCCLKPIPGASFEIYYGGPGSGKSSAIILGKIYQGFRRGESLVVTDTKGDLYRRTSAVARECGYNVKVLNLKPDELRYSDAFDLFKSLDPDADDFDNQCDVVTEIIFKNLTKIDEKEDYWYKNERNVTKMAIMYVASSPTYRKMNQNHLPYVYDFLAQNKPADIKALFSVLRLTAEDSPMYKCYSVFANTPELNQGAILNGAAVRLDKLANPTLRKVLTYDEIDTVLPMKEKCIYYLIIPDQDNTYKFASSLFFTQMFKDQCNYFDKLPPKEQKKQMKVAYLLDEYYSSGGVVGLPQKLSTIRSRGLTVSIILQSASQLASMYTEDEMATIEQCAAIKGLLQANDQELAEKFSKYFGIETIVTEANRYVESTGDVIHAKGELQKTATENKRNLMNPEEFLNGKMSRDHLCYQITGMPPIMLKKFFVEIHDTPNHFMEQWSQDLIDQNGEQLPTMHVPNWRKVEDINNSEIHDQLAAAFNIIPDDFFIKADTQELVNTVTGELVGTYTLDENGHMKVKKVRSTSQSQPAPAPEAKKPVGTPKTGSTSKQSSLSAPPADFDDNDPFNGFSSL